MTTVMETVFGVLVALVILVVLMVPAATWRRARRLAGFWLAGELPRTVHCHHCGVWQSALCAWCRDALMEKGNTK